MKTNRTSQTAKWRGISRRPIEPGFETRDGPFFLPAAVGWNQMEDEPESRLFHDFATDAVDHVTSLIMTVGGAVILSAPQYEQVLEPGDVLILTTPQPVRLRLRRSGEPWEFFYVNFKDPAGRQALEWLRRRGRGVFRIDLATREAKALLRRTHRLIHGLQRPVTRTPTEWSVETYAWLMAVADAARDARWRRAAARLGAETSPGLVATNFRTLKEYARQMNYSPGYLSRKLAKTWHKPPGATLRAAQIEHARRALLEGDLPIGEVAKAAGYESPSSFIRAFRKRLGMTPREYRRRGGEI